MLKQTREKCQLSRLARQQGLAGSKLRQQAAESIHRCPAKEHGLSAAGTGALKGPTLPNTSSSSAALPALSLRYISLRLVSRQVGEIDKIETESTCVNMLFCAAESFTVLWLI